MAAEYLTWILQYGGIAWFTFGVVGATIGKPEWLHLGVAFASGAGAIMAGINYEQTGYLGALIACLICVGIGGLQVKKLNPRPTRRERRAMRQLFGETIWQMLRDDPRRKQE